MIKYEEIELDEEEKKAAIEYAESVIGNTENQSELYVAALALSVLTR
jgi:hypothetical protein